MTHWCRVGVGLAAVAGLPLLAPAGRAGDDRVAPRTSPRPEEKLLAALWRDLGSDDAAKAEAAVRRGMSAAPQRATPPVRWALADGGNGHWYRAVLEPIAWHDANAAAAAAGSYLATITSARENAFVYDLVNDDRRFWDDSNPRHKHGHGPWLGGRQVAGSPPGDNWQWVTGEKFACARWAPGQPNDNRPVGPAKQDYLHFLGDGKLMGPTWNDLSGEALLPGYVVESRAKPPEPAPGEAARRRRSADRLAASLAQRLRGPKLDAKRIERLVAELDAESYRRRDAATDALRRLGPAIVPALRIARKQRQSPEVQARIELLLAELTHPEREGPEVARHLRAVRVLEVLGTERAVQTLRGLAAAASSRRVERRAARALAYIAAGPVHFVRGAEQPRPPNVLLNGGFERDRLQRGWPNGYGLWGGDVARIVGAENGITPRAGLGMLRFVYTGFAQPSLATTCEVMQVVNVRPYERAIRAGRATAAATSQVNRVAGGARTDTLFGIRLFAYAGRVRDHWALRDMGRHLDRSSAALFADADPATWEKLTTTMSLPRKTDFLVVQVQANEDIRNEVSGVEFDGHYADNVVVTVDRAD